MAKNSNNLKRKSTADRIFGAAVIILSIVVFIAIAYPLWFIVIASISNSNLVNLGKVTIWPKDIRFYGYKQIMDDARIWRGYSLCSGRYGSEHRGHDAGGLCTVSQRLQGA